MSCFLYTAWKHHQMAVCTAKQYAELSELWKTMTGERRQHKTQRRTGQRFWQVTTHVTQQDLDLKTAQDTNTITKTYKATVCGF